MIQDRPTVSIAMATYNGEKYIREQLDSLAVQDYLPYELVVTDDGSTDRTLEIVENFAQSAPFPVRIFKNQERLGFGDNFLKAAGLCNGELVSFSDQDDVWLPSKLTKCVNALCNFNADIVVHSAMIWYGGKKFGIGLYKNKVLKEYMPISLDPLRCRAGFAMVFRKKIIQMIDNNERPKGPYNFKRKMCHDEWIWFLSCLFGKVVLIPDILAWYRQHENNVAGARKKIGFFEALFRIVNQTDYREPFLLSKECGELVDIILCTHLNKDGRLKFIKTYFDLRTKIQSYRMALYQGRRGFIFRLRLFFLILFLGGYIGKNGGISLGSNALIKDLFYGVPGIYKLYSNIST